MTAVELNYEAVGPDDAPVLLMGGSLGTTLRMWDPQIRALAERYRVVRYDQRGHGGSPVPGGPYTIGDLSDDVVALMDRLGMARAHFCGLSIGGMTGQWLAINAPERIDRLVLICTSAHMPSPDAFRERAATVRGAGTTAGIADAVLERWFTADFAQRSPEIVESFKEMIASIPADGYAGCCEAVAGMDLREGLSQITAPTLVIAGAQDQATPPANGEAIVRAAASARLEVLDPAAHLASVEQDAAVTRLIHDHLGGAA